MSASTEHMRSCRHPGLKRRVLGSLPHPQASTEERRNRVHSPHSGLDSRIAGGEKPFWTGGRGAAMAAAPATLPPSLCLGKQTLHSAFAWP